MDTACSSSLVATHVSKQALEMHECSAALAEGVNVMLSPAASWSCAVAGMTSPRGRCFTFDESADGYLRSEAVGCFAVAPVGDVLDPKTYSDDAYCARSLGVSVKHDGKSASLTAPNGSSQRRLIEAVGDASCGCVLEAHGTGTALGDPIEVFVRTRRWGDLL